MLSFSGIVFYSVLLLRGAPDPPMVYGLGATDVVFELT